MATSSKVKFKLSALQAKAIDSIDVRIAQAQLELDSYLDDDALAQRVKEWRDRQETRISELFSKLGDDDLDDYRLSNWKVEPMPKVDRYDRREAERKLSSLRQLRSTVEAKSASLVPDEDGNVSLTKTQLRDFFAL